MLVGIEKVLLGTLIEYPILLDLHIERLMTTELTGKLESFKREIYRINNEFRDLKVITFYKEIQDDFATILEEVHGKVDNKTNQIMATNLYRRFPLLRWDPPEEFVNKAVVFFFDKLHLRQVRRELSEGYSNRVKMEDESELERITKLAQYFVEEDARVVAQDRVLAEEASQIRSQLSIRSELWVPAAA